MERLLTKVEIAGVCGRFARPENKKQGLHLLAEMAADESQKATLKAIGEWLEMEIYGAELELRVEDSLFLLGLIERIKRGEMPEEEIREVTKGFTEEEIRDLRHNASDYTIG